MENKPSGRNLTQQLVHTLGEAIVQGKYSDTQSIPSEAELCEEHHVSRSATREAVKMLTAKGLILSRPRQGIRIQARKNWNIFDPDVLSWLLKSAPSLQMLKEFLQLRIAVEPEAASLAANNQNAANIEQISLALERIKTAEEGLGDPLEADIDFHLAILNASCNPFFRQLSSFIATALRVSIRFTNRLKGVKSGNYLSHFEIYNAIVNGNAEQASLASKELLNEALELINSELDKESS